MGEPQSEREEADLIGRRPRGSSGLAGCAPQPRVLLDDRDAARGLCDRARSLAGSPPTDLHRQTVFVRNSTALAFIARTDVGTSAWPVMKITGTWILFLISSLCRSRPLSPARPRPKPDRHADPAALNPESLVLRRRSERATRPTGEDCRSLPVEMDRHPRHTRRNLLGSFVINSRQMKRCTRKAADDRALESMWQELALLTPEAIV
jgi:hypothetical protein